jgi:hypothetical protein
MPLGGGGRSRGASPPPLGRSGYRPVPVGGGGDPRARVLPPPPRDVATGRVELGRLPASAAAPPDWRGQPRAGEPQRLGFGLGSWGTLVCEEHRQLHAGREIHAGHSLQPEPEVVYTEVARVPSVGAGAADGRLRTEPLHGRCVVALAALPFAPAVGGGQAVSDAQVPIAVSEASADEASLAFGEVVEAERLLTVRSPEPAVLALRERELAGDRAELAEISGALADLRQAESEGDRDSAELAQQLQRDVDELRQQIRQTVGGIGGQFVLFRHLGTGRRGWLCATDTVSKQPSLSAMDPARPQLYPQPGAVCRVVARRHPVRTSAEQHCKVIGWVYEGQDLAILEIRVDPADHELLLALVKRSDIAAADRTHASRYTHRILLLATQLRFCARCAFICADLACAGSVLGWSPR